MTYQPHAGQRNAIRPRRQQSYDGLSTAKPINRTKWWVSLRSSHPTVFPLYWHPRKPQPPRVEPTASRDWRGSLAHLLLQGVAGRPHLLGDGRAGLNIVEVALGLFTEVRGG